jgi:hypothetical protein
MFSASMLIFVLHQCQKDLEIFEMWCWRRLEKTSLTDRVSNEAVLHRVKKERNIFHTMRRRKVNWIGHILKERLAGQEGEERNVSSCWMTLSKKILEIEGGSSGPHSLETQFGRGNGPVARQTAT